MNKFQTVLFFLLILILGYITESYIDYSIIYFGILRFLLIGISFYYSYKLIPGHKLLNIIENKWKVNESQSSSLAYLIWLFLAIMIIGLVNIGSEAINHFLLKRNNLTTIATIRDCYNSKGTQYCVYSYFINGKNYEHKFNNQTYQFKNTDTVKIKYYINNPIISQIIYEKNK